MINFNKEYSISIVVPIYNEGAILPVLVSEILEVVHGRLEYEIILVDDGSEDLSLDKVKKSVFKKNNNIYIVRLKENYGQGAALQAGFNLATKDITVTVDGDMQFDFNDVHLIVKKLIEKDYDVICGHRYNRKGPIRKRIFSKLANFIRRIVYREKIHDVGCSFRAYKTEVVKKLNLKGELHRFITAILLKKGYKIGEVKIKHRERRFGKSKYNDIGRLFTSIKPFLLLATNSSSLLNGKYKGGYEIKEIWEG